MGGFFGAACKQDAIADVFFGTDYHSHLGTSRGGMAAYDAAVGLQRDIHNIQNSPFRTKFEHIFEEMKGNSAIGCISDSDPQPLLMRSRTHFRSILMRRLSISRMRISLYGIEMLRKKLQRLLSFLKD